jgi:hypothetical protein
MRLAEEPGLIINVIPSASRELVIRGEGVMGDERVMSDE